MYFWQWKKNTTNVKFHHVRWFQYHFWLQIRFLHVKSPYRTIIKTTKWVIFHEIGWLQYCENTRIYYRELTSIWMNEWIWLGLSIFLSKNRRSTIKLSAKGGVYPPLLWLVYYIRRRWVPPPPPPPLRPPWSFTLSISFKLFFPVLSKICYIFNWNVTNIKRKVVNVFKDSDG